MNINFLSFSVSFFDQTILVASAQKNPVVAARLARQRKNEQMLFVDASYTRSRILIRLVRNYIIYSILIELFKSYKHV